MIREQRKEIFLDILESTRLDREVRKKDEDFAEKEKKAEKWRQSPVGNYPGPNAKDYDELHNIRKVRDKFKDEKHTENRKSGEYLKFNEDRKNGKFNPNDPKYRVK